MDLYFWEIGLGFIVEFLTGIILTFFILSFIFCFICVQMEDVIARMQDEKNGIPIRTVKSFLSKIPSVFSGKSQRDFDII